MDSVEASYAHAERVARTSAKNFYHTFRFLPRERRRGIHSVYAYSRRLDDAVDSVEEREVPEDAARRELAVLRSFLDDHPPPDPLVPALRDTIERFRIPRQHFDDLIAGMEMDLEQRRYATFDDLYRYCYRAASAVGLICIEIFGRAGEGAEGPAEALGIAMQLTNILRDIPEDMRRGRIYLPQEDLARFGVGEEDLARGVLSDGFRRLMSFQVARARRYFALAEPLFPLVRAESRYCPLLLRRVYSRILDRIERAGYDVFSRRPALSVREKLGLVARTWLEAKRGAWAS